MPKVVVESQAENVDDPLTNLSVSPLKLSPNLVELSETWSIKIKELDDVLTEPLPQGSKGCDVAAAADPLYL